jgi:peptidoglycan hydrolase CwlO-like protein
LEAEVQRLEATASDALAERRQQAEVFDSLEDALETRAREIAQLQAKLAEKDSLVA